MFKYREDEILAELEEYLKSTYNQHYVSDKDKVQTFDVYDALGSLATTSRDTAIKYLMRYGKKDGFNKKDLLKAMHYIILLWYASQRDQEKYQQEEDDFERKCLKKLQIPKPSEPKPPYEDRNYAYERP